MKAEKMKRYGLPVYPNRMSDRDDIVFVSRLETWYRDGTGNRYIVLGSKNEYRQARN